MLNIRKTELPEKCRVICVSDIHAHYDEFARLLQKCGYDKKNDYLFVLGDIMERGKQNIELLRYVMRLTDESGRVYCVLGNNDTMAVRMAYSDSMEKFRSRLTDRPENAFYDMAHSIGIKDPLDNFENNREKVRTAFKAELDFLSALPDAIETQQHIFVHAGLENRTDWENTDSVYSCCKRWWLREKNPTDKCIVVGHFPTYNYARCNGSNLPIIDKDKQMIAIDGGCTVKLAEQLNAFIIDKNGNDYAYSSVFEPTGSYRKCVAICDVISDVISKHIDFDNSRLTVLERKNSFTYVRDEVSGKEGYIPEKYTGYWGENLSGWTDLDAFVSIHKGEEFYSYDKVDEYLYGITESGKVGFIKEKSVREI